MRLVEGVVETDDVDALLAALGDVGDRHGVTVQAFDARYVADREHIERAVELADRALARGEAIARNRAVEILLYAAGRRQIDRALTMGVDAGRTPAVILVDGGGGSEASSRTDDEAAAAAAVRDLDAVDPGPVEFGDPARLRDFFDVGDAELAAADGDLAALVHERVALLVVDR